MSKLEIPQFTLVCINSEYPNHLIPGLRYKVDPVGRTSEDECHVYWYHPIEYRWATIGVFPLSCFNTEPIKKWVAEKKGIPYVPPTAPPVIQRARPVVQRQRPAAPAPVQRQRPTVIPKIQRGRPNMRVLEEKDVKVIGEDFLTGEKTVTPLRQRPVVNRQRPS